MSELLAALFWRLSPSFSHNVCVFSRSALREQIDEARSRKEREKQREREEDLRYQREAESRTPWGRPGAGAPLRSVDGRVVADIRCALAYLAALRSPDADHPRPLSQGQ